MMLVLEVEYLAGVSFAAIGPDSAVPDWPPQPDRVFSALVATWGAHGQRGDESEALVWLEQLPPPLLVDGGALERSSAIVFVPPNDSRTNRRKHARGVVPALRHRQPRRFPATRPIDSVLRFVWPDAMPQNAVLAALRELARDTSYVGHSSSLTRCRFLLEQEPPDLASGKTTELGVYPGRFKELRDTYGRFERSASGSDRPQKGAPIARRPITSVHRRSQFAERWLILEHGNEDVDGKMPDVRACALVARTIRDALLSGYQRIGLGDRIPEVISGHSANRAPSRLPHIAIVPLPFVGFSHADGHVMGFGIVPPEDGTLLQDQDFRQVLRKLAPMNEDRGRRLLTITTKEGTPAEQAFSIQLSPSFEAERRSLDPTLYVERARTFATATPIVLDRHLKERGAARQNEIETQVGAACRNIGLPEPEAVVADKYSAIEGTASAYPPGNSPKWLRWHMPASLASRQLTHALIRFSEPVDGPVILGAGRFLGLGLCRPLDPER
jgi:CRISPR-associated protein Csb2